MGRVVGKVSSGDVSRTSATLFTPKKLSKPFPNPLGFLVTNLFTFLSAFNQLMEFFPFCKFFGK